MHSLVEFIVNLVLAITIATIACWLIRDPDDKERRYGRH